MLRYFYKIVLLSGLLFSSVFLFSQTVYDAYPRFGTEGRLSISAINFPLFEESLNAQAAILFDAESGTILHSHNAKLMLPPASLTKIMTIHVLRSLAQAQGLDLDSRITYSEAAWAANAPPQSSLMFLGPKQITTLRELILGLAVSSGNDAAVAAAELAAGSVPAFVAAMNAEARRLGLSSTFFVEPSGYSPENRTSAADMARLVGFYLERWPDADRLFHSVQQFTYPDSHNIEQGIRDPYRGITQSNRNGLLWNFEGAEGLKTGFIDESGYHLVAVAKRGGLRLVAVVLGVHAESARLGSSWREADAAALLDFGFRNFERVRVNLAQLPPVRIRKYEAELLGFPQEELSFIVPLSGRVGGELGARGEPDARGAASTADGGVLAARDTRDTAAAAVVASALKLGVELPVEIEAPLEAGSRAAEFLFYRDDLLLRAELLRQEALPEEGGLSGFFDSLSMWFRDVFQGSPAGKVIRYWLAP